MKSVSALARDLPSRSRRARTSSFRGGPLLATLLPLMLFCAGDGLEAQEGRTTLAVWSGLPFPAEDLARWFDSGFDLGVSVERRVTDRWGIVLIGGRSHLDPVSRGELGLPEGEPGPPVVQWRYTVGLLLELTEPANPWEVSLNGGAGGITYHVKREEAAPGYFDTPTGRDFPDVDTDTGPALTAQLRVGRDLDEYLGLPVQMFFQSQWNFVFRDAGDPSEFLGRDSLFTQGFGLAYSF